MSFYVPAEKPNDATFYSVIDEPDFNYIVLARQNNLYRLRDQSFLAKQNQSKLFNVQLCVIICVVFFVFTGTRTRVLRLFM